jgi:5S rRNA maturation endonuclease (ribonuclease M5)
MSVQRLKQLLSALGSKTTGVTQKWTNGPCLFSYWKHDGQVDKNPSAGFKMSDGHYYCFTCGSAGSPIDVVLEMKMLSQKHPGPPVNFKQALALAEALEDAYESGEEAIPEYEEVMGAEDVAEFTVFPQAWLDSFPTSYHHPYLIERGISSAVAKAFDIRWDSYRQMVCFPTKDHKGRLVGMQGRSVIEGTPLRYYQYAYMEKRNSQTWLNEHRLNLDLPVVLTEGPFDLAKIFEVWENTVASFSSSINEGKLKKLRDVDELITFYDFGKGGDKARDTIDKRYPQARITHVIPTEKEGDAGAMHPSLIWEKIHQHL